MTHKPQAIRAGRVIVVAHTDREQLWRHADQLSSSERTIRETPHFVVCEPLTVKRGQVVLMHTFNRTTIDEDLPAMIADELGPIDVVSTAREYDDTLRAIVASTSPMASQSAGSGGDNLDLLAAWRHYGLNTLRRLRPLVDDHSVSSPGLRSSHVAQFAAVYRRIIEYATGASLLDVGTSLGFLPMLVAERHPNMTVVGCDNRQDAISCAIDLTAANGTRRVNFLLKDVLSKWFPEVGTFDTVTAVHLLEHLAEDQTPTALINMLRVTSKRLILSVPYEESPQMLYGHEQVFTLEKLRFLGALCADTLGGWRFRCEDVSGGLLIVDRGTT
jgi:SAM-dependent methyltransferase